MPFFALKLACCSRIIFLTCLIKPCLSIGVNAVIDYLLRRAFQPRDLKKGRESTSSGTLFVGLFGLFFFQKKKWEIPPLLYPMSKYSIWPSQPSSREEWPVLKVPNTVARKSTSEHLLLHYLNNVILHASVTSLCHSSSPYLLSSWPWV